jgi:hypothetical protein
MQALLAGIEPTISASEGPQTHALDSAATEIDNSPFIQLFDKDHSTHEGIVQNTNFHYI